MKSTICRPQAQQGVYIVEFAIAASVFFVLLFAVLEIGRLMYTWSTLNTVTQRGARIASVCPPNDPEVRRLTVQGRSGESGVGVLLPGFDESNISLTYLDENNVASYSIESIRFVRVSIDDYTHGMIIPRLLAGINNAPLSSPTFSTTVPAESLGWHPDSNTRSCTV